jgi:hypothetical protein
MLIRLEMPLPWIITSQQTMNDLIEWLQPLKGKMLSIFMPNWRPSCFIIDGEWAIQKNFCKHQIIIIIILMVTDVTQEDVIDYCGTWFGSYREGLATMFVDPKYILDDSDSENDGEANGDEGVIDIGLIGTMEEVVLPIDEVRAFDELESSSVPLEGTLIHLHHTMKEITKKCTQGGVALCDHATSIMKVVA